MESILIGASVALGFYLAYRIIRPPRMSEYDKWYDELLNSEKYKVKGQYEQ